MTENLTKTLEQASQSGKGWFIDREQFLEESGFAKVIIDENGLDAILIAGRVYKLEGVGKAHTSYFVSALRRAMQESSGPDQEAA